MSRQSSLLLLLALALLTFVGGRALLERGGASRLASSADRPLDDALLRVTRAPNDAASWLLLGERAQREGNLPLARAAFRAALELSPGDGDAHARLGFVLYEEGKDEQALVELEAAQRAGGDPDLLDFTLSMMRAHVDLAGPFPRFSAEAGGGEPEWNEADARSRSEGETTSDEPTPAPAAAPAEERAADDEELDDERDEAHEDEPEDDEADEGDDEEAAPRRPQIALAPAGDNGVCELALERRGPSGIFVVDVLVNGVDARLIVDTGASLTVLSRQLVDNAGLGLEEDGFLTVRTAAGQRRFGTAEVREVEVGGRVVEGVRVAICEECGAPGSDGLLGLDVQEPLGISMSPSRGTLRFADCDPPERGAPE